MCEKLVESVPTCNPKPSEDGINFVWTNSMEEVQSLLRVESLAGSPVAVECPSATSFWGTIRGIPVGYTAEELPTRLGPLYKTFETRRLKNSDLVRVRYADPTHSGR